MSFRLSSLPLLAVAVLLLAGCAAKPQLPVDLAPAAVSTTASARVGIAVSKPPKASMELPGASCLLCVIAAQAANTSVARHVETLPVQDLVAVRDQIAAALRKKGVNILVIAEPLQLETLPDMKTNAPNTAKRDFTSLKAKYGVDKLVLVDVEAFGLQRNYSAYIPSGAPRAFLRGSGSMINLSNNAYEWYLPLALFKAADGAWDEPPKYPGLTNAFYENLEMGKDRLLEPWVR
jgi:hypothetical protein